MLLRHRNTRRTTLGRAGGGAAILAAAALATPALASADPVSPEAPAVTASAQADALSITVANPNTDSATSCGAFAVRATDLAALEDDPSKFTEPGFLAWQTQLAERVGAEQEATFEVDVDAGIYAVIGECATPNTQTPVTGAPQLVAVGGPLSSLDLSQIDPGTLIDLVGFLPAGLDDLIPSLVAGSSTAPA